MTFDNCFLRLISPDMAVAGADHSAHKEEIKTSAPHV